ncbi:MAG: hypothetical protein Q9208_007496 [Pyrenodesmia sp. 3 TL-2023]
MTSASTPSVETLDIDQYINYDPSPILSDSYSPNFSQAKSMPTSFQPNEYSSNLFLGQPSQQTFAGPSHQYELHKQQTGLPAGALANTFAVNQNDHIVYGQAQRMCGIADGYFGANSFDDAFDFNTAPSQNTSIDMEVDFGSPLYDPNVDYINPNAIGGQESSPSSGPLRQRAWPGMHQQQAARAKAQAEAQQQRQKAVAPNPSAPASRHSSQPSTGRTAPAKDPIVEERISRLLNQMRHSSVATSNDDSSTPTASGTLPHLGRARKDEEDMDEDERLLASEEGKKLSSKERRQLRNKVSARAFRSRRKEYIGQLEGELAAKTAEADDFRAKNQELMAENTRLTDLTRMLLESPAFSSFLNELSGTDGQAGNLSAIPQQKEPPPKVEDTQPEAPKDVNPHQQPSHGQKTQANAQVGMTSMPETYSNYNAANIAWTGNVDSSLYDAQVYTLTSMPEGPTFDILDTGLLSGKSSSFAGSAVYHEAKAEYPFIEHSSPRYEEVKAQSPRIEDPSQIDIELDDSGPPYSLYEDTSPPPRVTGARSENVIFDSIEPEKASERIPLATINEDLDGQVNVASRQKFLRFCAMMEAPYQRVLSITSHL